MDEGTKLNRRFRLTVGAKLGGLISTLLMISVVGLVALATHLFVEYNTAQIQQTTYDTAANTSVQMRQIFEAVTDKARILGTILMEEGGSKRPIVRDFFSKDPNLLGVFIHRREAESTPATLHASAVADAIEGYDPKDLTEKGLDPDDVLQKGESGTRIFAARIGDDLPAMVVSIPFVREGERFTHSLAVIVRQELFSRNFPELASVRSYMMDRAGVLVAHPDRERALAHESVATVAIVQDFISGKSSVQKEYIDPTSGVPYLGAFMPVGFGGLGIVSEVEKSKAFEGANRVRYHSLLAAAIILFLAVMLGNYFSARTITGPILTLVDAAQRIARGDFKLDLKPRYRDEIGDLSSTFNEMARGLEERDKVKAVFNKFHNEAITKKLLSGEVKLGGEKLDATIFFSDVRGFTSLSESMQPEEVVEMLNEYMSRMVSVIHAHKGVVDKYVGDAIMALWGVPLAAEDDAENAVRACIEMRRSLEELNTLRISRGQPVLKIGMGLNTGPVIAGNIGSEQKMEYTVIGDAVNTASRIESMTKEYGTDLLVSKSVYDRTQSRFLFESVKSAKVKGKSSVLELHRVVGYIDAQGSPVRVETPYSSYTAEKSDKGEKGEGEAGAVVEAQTNTGIMLHRESTQEVWDPDTGEIELGYQDPKKKSAA